MEFKTRDVVDVLKRTGRTVGRSDVVRIPLSAVAWERGEQEERAGPTGYAVQNVENASRRILSHTVRVPTVLGMRKRIRSTLREGRGGQNRNRVPEQPDKSTLQKMLQREAAVPKQTEELHRGNAMAEQASQVAKTEAKKTRDRTFKRKSLWKHFLRSALDAASRRKTVMLFGGVIAAFLLLVTVLIAGIASSPFGIFFSIADDSGESIRTEVDSLSREFYEQVQTAMNSQPYDVLEIASDNGNYGVMWDEILPIYAVYCTTGDGKDVMSLTTDSVGLLRSLMNQLTFVSSEITVEEIPLEEEEADLMDAEEEKEEEPSTKEIRTLTVRIRHGDVEAYRSALGFTEEQEKLYKEITSERYRPFWAKVVGGYAAGGQNLIPYAGVLPKGIFSWPLAQSGSFNSGFGYRSDPFTGEQKFHGGIDLGAGEGIPILASADGTVSYANGTDTWGGGYGYYVLVDHGSGYSTLYGHCSAVCVVSGQVVRKGEVIAYVGSTGNSTGNHLHFEVRINGEKTDPMLFFGR